MLEIKQCKCCHEIKTENNFQLVKTGQEFVCDYIGMDKKWRIQQFYDILCKDCIDRIQLNNN